MPPILWGEGVGVSWEPLWRDSKTKRNKFGPFVAEILDFKAKIGRAAGPILQLSASSYAEVLRDVYEYSLNHLAQYTLPT